MRGFLFTLLLVLLSCFYVSAQLNQTVEVQDDKPLIEFIEDLEEKTPLRFFFMEEWIKPYVVPKELNKLSLNAILSRTLEGSEISFVLLHDYAVILFKDPERTLRQDEILKAASERKVQIEKVVLGSNENIRPGQKVVVRGTVINKFEQAALPGAFVTLDGAGVKTTSDHEGRFEIVVPPGEYLLTFNAPNFDEYMVSLDAYESGNFKVPMVEKSIVLDEVVVSDQNIVNRRIGFTPIRKVELTRSPSFLGTADIVKSLQIQAGVSSTSEASTGFNVRGGSVDQNLILIDGIPIFNASHAFGFFSAFNSNAIQDISFYKGGIPAEYGGRVSSVLSLGSREGSYERWGGEIEAGLISSSITVGGPIKKDESSIMISLRGSYGNWLLNALHKNYDDIRESSMQFYDASIRYTRKLSENERLSATLYASDDQFRLVNDTLNRWQNLAFGVRYDRMLGYDRYFNVGFNVGRYAYQVSEPQPETSYKLKYGITYPSLNFEVVQEGKHKITLGTQHTLYMLKPGDLSATSSESNSRNISMPRETSVESAIYISDSFTPADRFTVEAGVRLTLYNRIGKDLVYQYLPDRPREPRNITDSVVHDGGVVKTYGGPEPRLSVRYSLTPNASLKLGFNRIYQYLHLVSNTATVTPTDIWQSSDTYFKPQIADQFSFGISKDGKRGYQFSVESFYKHIKNIPDFKDGANLILNPALETSLLQGIGKAYGVEVTLAKTKGRLEGRINYTYSRSLRKINGQFEREKINNGDWYAANYDQPNILNIDWRYQIARKAFFSGIFTYRTGRPISVPIAAYEVNHVPVIDFTERNNYRLDDYHRLDLALVVEGSNKKSKRITGEWSLSVYNVYGRKNPYSAFFEYNVSGAVKPKQIALIGIPVPSIAYKIKF